MYWFEGALKGKLGGVLEIFSEIIKKPHPPPTRKNWMVSYLPVVKTKKTHIFLDFTEKLAAVVANQWFVQNAEIKSQWVLEKV